VTAEIEDENASARSDDIVAINAWLSHTRIRASCAVAVFTCVLAYLGIGPIRLPPILVVCTAMALFSVAALRFRFGQTRPWQFFYLQTLFDVIGVTVGLALGVEGRPGVLFSTLYVMIVVPSSLASVRSGLFFAAIASCSHLFLLSRGPAPPEGRFGIEAAAPIFLFFLVAEQCFFYAGHLAKKNEALARLADRLQSHRERLENLVAIARSLNSTVDSVPLLTKTNQAALAQLRATSAGTFLVDMERRTFRLVAVSTGVEPESAFSRIDFPIDAFPIVDELARARVVTLSPGEVKRVPTAMSAGLAMSSIHLAGLYRDERLVGFLAVGYAGPSPGEAVILEQLAAIAEHCTIALGNARLLEEAREASALKSEFVSTISHELRTPLNVIIGYTEMLRDGAAGALSDRQHALFRRIETSSRELFDLIEAVLQVGRLETGGAAAVMAPVTVDALLKTIEGSLGGLPLPEQVDFAWEIEPDLSGTIVTDAPKVALVVRNLVGNAFKFTPAGRVVMATRRQGDHLVFEVRDTGVGIAPENVPRIFEMFRQLKDGVERGGVGLGLHIVKQVVSRLGGVIQVESELGKGSCFRVTLPRLSPAVETVARRRALTARL
jgi:signal transduction histidine kinase